MPRHREEGNNSKKSSSMSVDSDGSSSSDSGDSHTLYELQQLARAYNTEHAPIPLKQNKAALTAVLLERGVLTPAGARRRRPPSPSDDDDGCYDDDDDDDDDDEYGCYYGDDGYEYHAEAVDDVFEDRGMRLIDRLADMAAERAVERVLALPKNTLSSLSGLYK
jgi:hypothetical protein